MNYWALISIWSNNAQQQGGAHTQAPSALGPKKVQQQKITLEDRVITRLLDCNSIDPKWADEAKKLAKAITENTGELSTGDQEAAEVYVADAVK